MSSKEIQKRLETVSQKYSELSLLRAAVVAIPYVGSSIDILLGAKASAHTQKRINDFISNMHEEMARIDERLVDRPFLESEEFFDLLLKAFDNSLKTRSLEKKKLYAKILTSRIAPSGAKSEMSEDHLNIVTELSEDEILIAKHIFEVIASGKIMKGDKPYKWANKQWLEDSHASGLIPNADYDYVLLRLQRVGLLKEQTGAFLGYAGGDYQMTDAFTKLMQALRTN